MPELPEVENVVRQLQQELKPGSKLLKVEKSRLNLRFESRNELSFDELTHSKLLSVSRRAKYIILEVEDFVLLSHLGMTGVWYFDGDRDLPPHAAQHTHLRSFWETPDALRTLSYCDPRRFGAFLALKKETYLNSSLLSSLGPEPLSDSFGGDYLFDASRSIKRSIKSFIMDQSVVVGVGNIYASEALFYSSVHPERQAGTLKLDECARLAQEIKMVLLRAIDAGGSTLQDYRQTNGQSGQFQNSFAVYGREFEPCYGCGEPIDSKVLSGRMTYFCNGCQR